VTERPFVWFPTTRAGTGTDVFTQRLAAGLQQRGLRAEITWLPLRAEYAPWTVPIPIPPRDANLVHVNTWLHPRFIPQSLKVLATLHHSIHDPALVPYKGAMRVAYHRWWIAPVERSVLQMATRVTAVSHFAAAMARQTLCDVPVEVIHNGVDTATFHGGERGAVHDGPFRLLYVGSWMTRKGVDLLAPIMRELGGDFRLDYTGFGASTKEKARMPANMHDIGRLRDDHAVAGAMRRADALLFPSRSEGFGLVAAEAIACALPVIATRGSSLVEVVEDGQTGVLCPQDDVHSFAEAARAIRRDRPRWRAVEPFRRSFAAKGFASESMIDAYVKTYAEVLNPL
jgi:glycosyltransferase involved in cell wall biosynthesis